jgi:hypothetical protein
MCSAACPDEQFPVVLLIQLPVQKLKEEQGTATGTRGPNCIEEENRKQTLCPIPYEPICYTVAYWRSLQHNTAHGPHLGSKVGLCSSLHSSLALINSLLHTASQQFW